MMPAHQTPFDESPHRREPVQMRLEQRLQILGAMDILDLHGVEVDDLPTLGPEYLKDAHAKRVRASFPGGFGRRAGDKNGTSPDALEFLCVQQAYEILHRFATGQDDETDGATSTDGKSRAEKARSGPRIIAVGGGKGGVGKSLVSSSLAIGLALSGKKVLAVDLDLGGANLHLFLGVKRLTTTLNTFLTHRGADLWSLPTATDFENLDLLGGDGSQLGSANVHYAKKMSLIRRLSIAPYDVVVCDLGAGTDFNTLDFFLMAHEHMLVTNTEPTALLDAYGLIKTALYRRLDGHVRAMRVEGDLRKRLDDFFFGRAKTETPQSLTAFLAAVRREDAVLADKLKAEAGAFSVRLVINSSMSANDPARVARIGELAVKNLSMAGIETARIPFDMSIRRSIERVVPHVVAQPESPASQALFDLTGGFVPNPSAALSTIRASLVHRRRGLARTSA